MLPQLLSGQRIAVSLNGKEIAYGVVMDFNIDTHVSETRGVDSVLPIELYRSFVSVAMSLRVYRTPENDPGTLGLMPAKMDHENDQLASGFAVGRYMQIEVRDQQTDKIVLYFPRALMSSRSGSTSAGDLTTETWSVVCIGYRSQ